MLRPQVAGGYLTPSSPSQSSLLRRFASTPAVVACPGLRIATPSLIWDAGLHSLRAEPKLTSIVAYAKSSKRSLVVSSLKVVPGIGTKYEKLLNTRDVFTVADLLAIYRKSCHENTTLMELWLQDAGIVNTGCQNLILQYLATQSATPAAAAASPASSTGGPAGHGTATAGSSTPSSRASAGSGTGGSGSSSSSPLTPGGASSWLFPKVTLSVEGNISAGKSTFLRLLEQSPVLKGKLQLVPEPVEKWQSVGGGKVNLLMEFYRSPERFAYTFQNYVFLTRVMQERESYVHPAINRLLERSIFSDRMVFVRAVHAAKYMNDTELAIYDSWFDPILTTLPTLVPNGFIYLRASPETCHQRLKRRGREEEDTVKLDYLAMLHRCHEDWLYQGGDPLPSSGPGSERYVWATRATTTTSSSSPVGEGGSSSQHQYSFSIHPRPPSESEMREQQVGWASLPPPPGSLDGCVRFMDSTRAPHMHPRLHTIPSLVLDCEEDVDIGRDDSHQARIVTTVLEFSEYVRGVTLARGEALATHERLAAASQRRGGQPAAAGAGSSSSSPGSGFSGYAVDVRGATLYVAPSAPLLAFATAEGAALGAGGPASPPAPSSGGGSGDSSAGPAASAQDTASSREVRQQQGKQQTSPEASAQQRQQQQQQPSTATA